MEPTRIQITQKDGYKTSLLLFETNNEASLGSVLVLHGMAEHYGRYLEFIQALNEKGFDVYTYNHRGHGTDKKLSELGYIAKKNGASLVVEDALNISNYIKGTARNNKLAIFGHSMGSLILRCLLQKQDNFSCAVASSSTMPPVAVSAIGSAIAGTLSLIQGPAKKSEFLQKIMFGGKAYTSLCTRTTYDWLTRNNTVIGKYMDDPYCGYTCTTSFYRDLTVLCQRCAVNRNISKTRKDFPLLLLTGEKDPVSGYGSQLIALQKKYNRLGFTNTSLTIYAEDRHELLNELNAAEVYQDIFHFLHTHLQ
jgi:alpha-beta hydrolase superfamily lysophospholipase